MTDTTSLIKRYGFPSTKLLGQSAGKLTLEHRQYARTTADELGQLSNIPTEQLLLVAEDFTPDTSSCTRWLKMATSDLDRASDRLDLSGIVCDNFALNPQLLWMHGLTNEPIHTIGRIRALAINNDALYALAEYADAPLSPLADQIAQLEAAGFLPANSIGFHPIEWEENSDGGLDFLRWELIECSKVELPMNPFAINDTAFEDAACTASELQEFDLETAAAWLNE